MDGSILPQHPACGLVYLGLSMEKDRLLRAGAIELWRQGGRVLVTPRRYYKAFKAISTHVLLTRDLLW